MTTRWKRWSCMVWLFLIPFSGNAATPMISAGANESLFLNTDGTVWGAGNVSGHSPAPGVTSPVRVLQLANITAIAADNGTEYALLADGTLWGSGSNNVGQLGDGTTQSRSQAQRVPGLPVIKAFAAGSGHVLALGQDGTIWAWGSNAYGELGDGTQIDRHAPLQVIGLSNVISIAAGTNGFSSLALRADGTVWVWGWTCCRAAGDGINVGPNDPGYNHLVPAQVHNLDQVVGISAGSNHNMALRADGTVWTWGKGGLGENGTGATSLDNRFLPIQIPGLDHVAAIDARGVAFSLALKTDGTVWAWGNNNVGQLGVSGSNYSASPIQVPGLSNIVAIAAGFAHVLAMRRDGTVLAWGSNSGVQFNSGGQLGDNTLQDRAQPLPVSGPGGTGQLNLLQPAPASFNKLPSAQINLSVGSGSAPLTVQATATNVTDPDGTVSAFYWKTSDGQQATGQSVTFVFSQAGNFKIDLLVADNVGATGWAERVVAVTPAPVGPVQASPKVAVGQASAIALTDDGRILTWGANGTLGRYVLNPYLLPVANSLPAANGIAGAVDLAVDGGDGKHVLLANGKVLGWGQNANGEVGSGSQASSLLQPQVLSGLPPVRALSSGFIHNFALTRDGRVFAWGSNAFGQLGLGDNIDRFQPTEVAGLTNVIAIVGGYRFSAALKTDGTVWAWGDNSNYQLGDGTQISSNRPSQVPGLANVKKIFPAAFGLMAQKTDGAVSATGNLPFNFSTNVPGPNLGARRIPELDNALQIAGWFQHVIVLKNDGTVWTGGFAGDLALGFQNPGNITGLKQLPGISDATSVATSLFGAMALRRDGTVLAWGLNNFGQIGDGTLAFQQTPVLVVNETANNFLDLVPEVPNTIPQNLIPPFLVATYADGSLSSTTLYTDIKGIPAPGTFASATDFGRFAALSYNVNVAANIPSLQSAYFQLDSSSTWSLLRWPMAEFLRGVALDSQNAVVRAQILQNVDLSQYICTSILVGYGTDPDEMVRNARYRTIFTVTPPP